MTAMVLSGAARPDGLREIKLYGVLGAKFGRVHWMAVNSTREAMSAMCAVIPGFRRFMINAKARGLEFACFLGKTNIGRDELTFPAGRQAIRIAPVIAGSKRGGIFQTIAGVILTVVGVVMMVYDVPGGAQVAMMGGSMALGGVMQMLSPQQAGLNGADNGTSYYFNGAVNSEAQGSCVPVIYGETWAGSKVVSSAIVAEDQVSDAATASSTKAGSMTNLLSQSAAAT